MFNIAAVLIDTNVHGTSNSICLIDSYLDAYLPACDDAFHTIMENEMPKSRGSCYSSRPLIVQVCGHDARLLAEACRILAESGRCDGVDLNLGNVTYNLYCKYPMKLALIIIVSLLLNRLSSRQSENRVIWVLFTGYMSLGYRDDVCDCDGCGVVRI